MKSQKAKVSNAGILLAGDPGVGKTSFIRFLCKLFGLNLVVLEVPHITEEHIINIPYIRYNPVNNQVKTDVVRVEQKSDFDLVLAESNLYTVLKNTKPIPDKAYLKAMYSSDSSYTNVRRIFEELGGSSTEIPNRIVQTIQSKQDTKI
jgi:midasin (ATPase involved in ribosome maturation)